jgi:hypothetical protein
VCRPPVRREERTRIRVRQMAWARTDENGRRWSGWETALDLAAPVRQQTNESDDNAASNGTAQTIAFGSNTAAGSCQLGWGSWDHSGPDPTPTWSDSQGNTWSSAQNIIDSSTDTQKACVGYSVNGTSAAANTVSINFGASPLSGRCVIAWEITGAKTGTAPVLNGQFQNGPSGADTVSSLSVTPTGTAGNLIIGVSLQASASDGSPTPSTGWTSDGTWVNFGHGGGLKFAVASSKTQTGTASVTATFTPLSSGKRFLTHVAAFQEPVAGGSVGRFFFAGGY